MAVFLHPTTFLPPAVVSQVAVTAYRSDSDCHLPHFSTFKDPSDYIGSTSLPQDNIPTLSSVNKQTYFHQQLYYFFAM